MISNTSPAVMTTQHRAYDTERTKVLCPYGYLLRNSGLVDKVSRLLPLSTHMVWLLTFVFRIDQALCAV